MRKRNEAQSNLQNSLECFGSYANSQTHLKQN